MSFLFFQIIVGILCFILTIAVYVPFKKLIKLRGNLEAVVFVLIGIPFIFLFAWITNDCVSVVCEIDSPTESSESVCFSKSIIYRDNQNNAKYFDVTPGNVYVINKSSKEAIFYPVGYGNASVNDNDVIFIEAHSVSRVPKHIDHYFYEPESISVDENKSGEVRYIVDWTEDALKRLDK